MSSNTDQASVILPLEAAYLDLYVSDRDVLYSRCWGMDDCCAYLQHLHLLSLHLFHASSKKSVSGSIISNKTWNCYKKGLSCPFRTSWGTVRVVLNKGFVYDNNTH